MAYHRNIAAGYFALDDDGRERFHPIRASYDYDPSRVGEKPRPKKRKRNPLTRQETLELLKEFRAKERTALREPKGMARAYIVGQADQSLYLARKYGVVPRSLARVIQSGGIGAKVRRFVDPFSGSTIKQRPWIPGHNPASRRAGSLMFPTRAAALAYARKRGWDAQPVYVRFQVRKQQV